MGIGCNNDVIVTGNQMHFKVHNPLDNSTITVDSTTEWQEIVTESLSQSFNELLEREQIRSDKPCPVIESYRSIAVEYAKNKFNYEGPVEYFHSVFNVTTGKTISRFYHLGSPEYFGEIKVSDEGEVVEYYRFLDPKTNNKKSAESIDLTTGEVLEYYVWVDKDLNKILIESGGAYALAKYNLNDELLALNIVANGMGLSGLPEDKRIETQNFKHSSYIFEYKQQTYGFVVHYWEPIHSLPTPEEIPQLKEKFINYWMNLVRIEQVELS